MLLSNIAITITLPPLAPPPFPNHKKTYPKTTACCLVYCRPDRVIVTPSATIISPSPLQINKQTTKIKPDYNTPSLHATAIFSNLSPLSHLYPHQPMETTNSRVLPSPTSPSTHRTASSNTTSSPHPRWQPPPTKYQTPKVRSKNRQHYHHLAVANITTTTNQVPKHQKSKNVTILSSSYFILVVQGVKCLIFWRAWDLLFNSKQCVTLAI